MPNVTVKELSWTEQSLGELDLPKERLKLSAGFGSGLATRPGASASEIWAICDRGPNLKLSDAEEIYGWAPPAEWRGVKGAKLMPRPDIGPSLALLAVEEDRVTVRRTLRLACTDGTPVSGLPIPESGHAECEPVLDLDGSHCKPDPNGMDTEGLALLEDGSFWASEEYGPSLVRIAPDGRVLLRLVPEGVDLAGAGYPVEASLPALAARRHLNRGFEAVAVAPGGALFLAFQSPLAHPSRREHEQARHVRLWQLDASGVPITQFAYRLDDPPSFRRDSAEGEVKRSDLKICEVAAVADDLLLVLERASATCKIYRVRLDPGRALSPDHWQIDTSSTLEQMSAAGEDIPELPKELLFTSDEWPEVCPDIEGMALLDERSLLIVSDNDFGCEGKQTRFYRLDFADPLLPA